MLKNYIAITLLLHLSIVGLMAEEAAAPATTTTAAPAAEATTTTTTAAPATTTTTASASPATTTTTVTEPVVTAAATTSTTSTAAPAPAATATTTAATPTPTASPAPEIAAANNPTNSIQLGTAASFESLNNQFNILAKDLNKMVLLKNDLNKLEENKSRNWWADVLKTNFETKQTLEALVTESEAAVNEGSQLERLEWWNKIKVLTSEVQKELTEAKAKNNAFNISRLEPLSARISNIKNACKQIFDKAIDQLNDIPNKVKNEIANIESLFVALRDQKKETSEHSTANTPATAATTRIQAQTRTASARQSTNVSAPTGTTPVNTTVANTRTTRSTGQRR